MATHRMPMTISACGVKAEIPREATVEIGAGGVDADGVNPRTISSILHAVCIIAHFISGPVSVVALKNKVIFLISITAFWAGGPSEKFLLPSVQ